MTIRITAGSQEKTALQAVCSIQERVRAFNQMLGHLRAARSILL